MGFLPPSCLVLELAPSTNRLSWSEKPPSGTLTVSKSRATCTCPLRSPNASLACSSSSKSVCCSPPPPPPPPPLPSPPPKPPPTPAAAAAVLEALLHLTNANYPATRLHDAALHHRLREDVALATSPAPKRPFVPTRPQKRLKRSRRLNVHLAPLGQR